MKETNVSMMYNSNEVKNVFSVLYKTPMSNTFDRKVFTAKLPYPSIFGWLATMSDPAYTPIKISVFWGYLLCIS